MLSRSLQSILEELPAEGWQLEYKWKADSDRKSDSEWASDLLRELVAFANASGGVLIIGVSDKEVAGVSVHERIGTDRNWAQKILKAVRDKANDICEPQLSLGEPEHCLIDDKDFVSIRVYQIALAPIQIKSKNKVEFIIRNGSRIANMSYGDLQARFRQIQALRESRSRNIQDLRAWITDMPDHADPSSWFGIEMLLEPAWRSEGWSLVPSIREESGLAYIQWKGDHSIGTLAGYNHVHGIKYKDNYIDTKWPTIREVLVSQSGELMVAGKITHSRLKDDRSESLELIKKCGNFIAVPERYVIDLVQQCLTVASDITSKLEEQFNWSIAVRFLSNTRATIWNGALYDLRGDSDKFGLSDGTLLYEGFIEELAYDSSWSKDMIVQIQNRLKYASGSRL